MLRLSIVTICFNNPDDVRATCASVDMQLLRPYEHIIIDGSTKPDIKNYLESTPQPPYRRWICERDKGISDAFNKGIRNAQGEVIYLLNSGDTMADDTVAQKAMAVFEGNASVMWVHGRLNMVRSGIWMAVGRPFERSKLYRGMRAFHPTMYVRRELYDRHGLFDLTIRYAMDYDFLCRIAGEQFAFIDYPLATFDPNGRSTVDHLKSMKECYAVYRKYYGGSLKQTLWGWWATLAYHLVGTGPAWLAGRMGAKAKAAHA